MMLFRASGLLLVLTVVTISEVLAVKDVKDSSVGGFFRGVFHKVTDAILPANSAIKSIFNTVGTCSVTKDKGWYDEELGNFTIGPDSPYCDSSCARAAVCCAPEKPAEVKINFYHFDKRNQSYVLNMTSPESAKLVQQNPRLLWFVHGFKDNMFKNPVFNQTRDAFIKRGYDVVQVDWSGGNLEYFQAVANIRLVGAMTGRMIKNYDVAHTSTCVGFSLGGHVCGEVGSWIKKHGQVLNRCIGIDPAGPAFDNCSNSIRLDKEDCGLVVAIHTSQFEGIGSLIDNEGLGTKD